MLTQIDVVYGDESGEQALALPILGVTPKDSLLIRKVTGLNPPDPTLFIGEYARDGGFYQGRRVGARNVVLTMDLNPNPALGETIRGLREILYKTFMDPQVDADYIRLVLHDDDNQQRYLVGYAEKFETEIFDIETMAQVSIICPDPYIRDQVETVLEHPTGWITVPFTYTGTAETGFEVEIEVTSDTPTITFENNGRTMVIDYAFVDGDYIYINTNRGSRDLRRATSAAVSAVVTANPTWSTSQVWEKLIADGNTTPLIAKLSPLSRWLELHSQNNQMKVYGPTPADVHAVVKKLKYTATYWGV